MKILYFAQIREMIGQSEEIINPPDRISNVADFIDWMKQRGHPYQEAMAFEPLNIAVNQEFASLDTALKEVYEIAFFPPITGG